MRISSSNPVSILVLRSALITSIQTELSDSEATQFQKDLLYHTASIDPIGVIIDISSLDVVDSYIGRIIVEIALGVKLLGSKFVLSGVQPEVASALLEIGMTMKDIDTFLSLDLAFNYLEDVARSDSKVHL